MYILNYSHIRYSLHVNTMFHIAEYHLPICLLFKFFLSYEHLPC